MSQELGLKLENVQRLIITPKLRQALTILQLPTYDLANYLQQEMAANPMLELDRPWEEPAGDDPYQREDTFTQEWLEYWFSDSAPRKMHRREQTNILPVDRWHALGQDKRQELVLQIRTLDVGLEIRELAVILLDHLDSSGFLLATDEELAKNIGAPLEGVLAARQLLQTVEPRGLGCYSLAHYLCQELAARGQLTPKWEAAISEHLSLLATGRVAQVAAALDCSAQEMQALLDLLRSLPARPGGELTPGSQNQFVIPDVLVVKTLAGYEVNVNERSVPRLALSSYYLRMLQETDDPEVQYYIRDRLRAATWLVRSLEQRRQTLTNVAHAIVAGQHGFLQHGLSNLRPLTLAQVASSIDLHESTVSRAVANKYMQTPRGMYPMRFFFTSGVADDSGFGMAKEGVQDAIGRLIAAEDTNSPLSDQSLADLLLAEQGVTISRRTVGKYRAEMGILSSRRRKSFRM